jgi:hypothetical protein
MSDEVRLLSYREIAEQFGLTLQSARNLVRKRCWGRTLSNDGRTALIRVPCDAIPPPTTKPADAAPDLAPDGAPGSTSGSPSAPLAALAKHIETLQAEITPLRAVALEVAALRAALDAAHGDAHRLRDERDSERVVALSVGAEVAALRATLEAVREERDRLLTREHLREQRRWWQRLAG